MAAESQVPAPSGDVPTPRKKWSLPQIFTRRLLGKTMWYWLIVSVAIFGWAIGSHLARGWFGLDDRSSVIFQKLADWTTFWPAKPRYVRLVLIQDDQYYGELGGRRPTRRDYLARIVDRLVKLNAHVIGLDFDLRLPKPDATEVPAEYKAETDQLICSIERAAQCGKKIVLATPISFVDGTQDYQRDADTFQLYGLCGGQPVYKPACKQKAPSSCDNPVDKNVRCGHISLSSDNRARIPERLRLQNGKRLDSFSIAMARADDAGSVEDHDEDPEYPERLVQFIAQSKFRNPGVSTSSGAIFSNQIDRDIFDSKAVIVGADWSEYAHSRGPRVDLHDTPLDKMIGAIMHANFVEALRTSHFYRPLPHYLAAIFDVIGGFIAAIGLSKLKSRHKKVVIVAVAVLVLLIAQWFLLVQFGVFFDVILVVLGIGLHSIFESEKHGQDAAVAVPVVKL